MGNLTLEKRILLEEQFKKRREEQKRFHKENIDKVIVNRKCSCGTQVTNANCFLIGQNELGLWFNCPCDSTLIQVPNTVLEARETI